MKTKVNKARIREIYISGYCPACNNVFVIKCYSPSEIGVHQETHLYECPHCYVDMWWNVKVQLEKKGMPKYKKPKSF